jgi:hypothetical protein
MPDPAMGARLFECVLSVFDSDRGRKMVPALTMCTTKKATSQARSVIGVRMKSDRAANLLYWVHGFIVPPNEQDPVIERRATSAERFGVRLEDERTTRLVAPLAMTVRDVGIGPRMATATAEAQAWVRGCVRQRCIARELARARRPYKD